VRAHNARDKKCIDKNPKSHDPEYKKTDAEHYCASAEDGKQKLKDGGACPTYIEPVSTKVTYKKP
jgi:hypothetical protein